MKAKDILIIITVLTIMIAAYMGMIHATCKMAGTKTIVMGGSTVVCY